MFDYCKFFLIFWSLWIPVSGGNIPVSEPGGWNPVEVSGLTCPMTSWSSRLQPEIGNTRLGIRLLQTDSPHEVEGYFCTKVVWRSTCDFRWYGPRYITHERFLSKPESLECERHIGLYKLGEPVESGYPPAECSWNSIEDKDVQEVKITPKTLIFDPYDGKLVGPELASGVCKESPCDGRSDHQIWLLGGLQNTACPEMAMDFLLINHVYLDGSSTSTVDRTSSVVMTNGHSFPLENLCRLTFCDHEGYKTPGGWFFQPAEGGARNVIRILDDLDMCESDQKIKVPGTWGGITDEHDLEIIDSVENYICQDVIRTIKRDKRISPWELPYLAPREPGVGLVYRINRGVLESGPSTYRRGRYLTEQGSNLIGETLDNERIVWENWVPLTDSGDVLSGPNGMIKTKGKIYPGIPEILQVADQIGSHLEYSAQVVNHPIIRDLPIIHHNDSYLHQGRAGSGDIVHSLEEWFGVMGGRAIMWTIGLLIFGLTALTVWGILKWVIPIVFKRRSPVPRASTALEMIRV